MRVSRTALRIVETDAYVAHIRFHRAAHDMTHRALTAKRAAALLNSPAAAAARELRAREQPTLQGLPFSPTAPSAHPLRPSILRGRFESRRRSNTRAMLNCSVGSRSASSYCGPCQEAASGVVAIWGSGTGRACFVQHARACAPSD